MSYIKIVWLIVTACIGVAALGYGVWSISSFGWFISVERLFGGTGIPLYDKRFRARGPRGVLSILLALLSGAACIFICCGWLFFAALIQALSLVPAAMVVLPLAKEIWEDRRFHIW